jgi:hypothetical protein
MEIRTRRTRANRGRFNLGVSQVGNYEVNRELTLNKYKNRTNEQ